MAPPGFGKTSAIRNLPWKTTGLINADKKELPIQGWKKKYVSVTFTKDGFVWPDLQKSNYVETSKFQSVMETLAIWDERPDIEYIGLDTITHLITHHYVKNTIGKDYKAYQAMGGHFYELADFVRQMKKNVFILAHIRKKFNEMGDKVSEMKAPGNMISDFEPPSFFTTVLLGEVKRVDEKNQYLFRTQSLNDDPAKSPAYFTGEEAKTALEFYEPNDLKLIFDKLKKFEDTIELANDPNQNSEGKTP